MMHKSQFFCLAILLFVFSFSFANQLPEDAQPIEQITLDDISEKTLGSEKAFDAAEMIN